MNREMFVKELRLTGLLKKKQSYLTEYKKATEKQARFIKNSDDQSLLENLGIRSKIIDAVNDLDFELQPLLAQYLQSEQTLQPQNSIGELIADIKNTLQSIAANDVYNKEFAQNNMNRLIEEAQLSMKSTKGTMAYIKNASVQMHGSFDVKK